jgi:hypothetical protein
VSRGAPAYHKEREKKMAEGFDGNFMFFGGEDDAWLDDAACADLPIESFFVQAGHVIDEEVLNVCRGCPVRIPCLRHSYRENLSITGGYFGGMSPGQRREMTFEQALEFTKTDLVRSEGLEQVRTEKEPIIYS